MDARELSRVEIGLLSAAVGSHRMTFVSLVFAAIIKEHGLDLQIVRDGHDYVLVGIETVGDAAVAEHRLPIAWPEVGEDVRIGVLRMYVQGLLDGHARWRRCMAQRLAALGMATVPAND